MIVDLVLLDADGRSDGSHGIHTAGGIFNAIERQLQDPDSHLRRKSAFGAMVRRGALIRFIRSETFPAEPAEREDASPTAAGSEDSPMAVEMGSNEFEPSLKFDRDGADSCSAAGGWSRSGASTPQRATSASVPKISHFPIPRPQFSLLGALAAWCPSCSSACTMAPQKRVHSCATVWACAPANDQGQGTEMEAGLGGWPLCISQAFVAFPSHAEAAPPRGKPLLPNQQYLCFRRCAVEVDDTELVIIFGPQHRTALAPTTPPTTASTTSSSSKAGLATPTFNDESYDGPFALLSKGRMVVPCKTILSIKLRPTPNPATLVDDDGTIVWPNWVELVGKPTGMEQCERLLIALPSMELAVRMHDNLERPRPAARAPRGIPAARNAVRCELRIAAKIDLDKDGSKTNCVAVVRRGLCEACHVSSDRIRVGGVVSLGAL